MGKIRCEGLLKALKTLDPTMVIEPNEIIASGAGLPPTMRDKTVAIRIEEVEVNLKILSARLQATKEMLEVEEGGKEALANWVWVKPKEE